MSRITWAACAPKHLFISRKLSLARPADLPRTALAGWSISNLLWLISYFQPVLGLSSASIFLSTLESLSMDWTFKCLTFIFFDCLICCPFRIFFCPEIVRTRVRFQLRMFPQTCKFRDAGLFSKDFLLDSWAAILPFLPSASAQTYIFAYRSWATWCGLPSCLNYPAVSTQMTPTIWCA